MSGLTVPRTETLLRNSTREVVSVRRFGARGDGVFNNLTAFRDTLAAANDGDTITIPPGDYLIEYQEASGDTSVFDLVGRKDLTVLGEQGSKLTIKHDVTGGSRFAFARGPCERVRFEGLDIDWESLNSPPTGSNSRGTIFDFRQAAGSVCKEVTVQHCRLKATHSGGANMGGTSDDGKMGVLFFEGDDTATRASTLRFLNNDVHDSRGRVIWLWYTDKSEISGNTFTNCGGHTLLRMLTQNRGLRVTRNHIVMPLADFTAPAIYLSGQSGDASHRWVIAENIIECGNNGGIEILGSSYGTILGNVLTHRDNYAGAGREGIRIWDDTSSGGRNAEHIAVSANVIYGMATSVILLGKARYINVNCNQLNVLQAGANNSVSPSFVDVVGNTFFAGQCRTRGLSWNVRANTFHDSPAQAIRCGTIDAARHTVQGNTIYNAGVSVSDSDAIDMEGAGHVVENNRVFGSTHRHAIRHPNVNEFLASGKSHIRNNWVTEGTSATVISAGANVETGGNIIDDVWPS